MCLDMDVQILIFGFFSQTRASTVPPKPGV
jgi:hypothetical protein